MSASANIRRRFWRDASGAAALEFALVMPVFCAIMFGIFEFGWAQHKLSSIRFAMESAARTLVIDSTTSETTLSNAVKAKLNGMADQNVTITKGSVVTDASGAKVVKLTGTYTSSIGIPGMATIPINWSTVVWTPTGT